MSDEEILERWMGQYGKGIEAVCYGQLKDHQLSAESGVSEAALYQRLSRARKKLKLLLVTALLLLCGLAGAALGAVQKNRVNRQELPELDPMQVVSASRAEKRNGQPETREYSCYAEAQEALGVRLLALPEESASPGTVYVRTDGTNYALLRVKNFCAVENQAISLNVDVVLSAEQLANLWGTDYLGAYRFVGQTVSEQGYKVDILEETDSERPCRIAVFVADGVRYELRGRVPQNVLISLISQLK